MPQTPKPSLTAAPSDPAPDARTHPTGPTRRVRARSIGGRVYDALNSGDVVVTGPHGAVSHIDGSSLHHAVMSGVAAGRSRGAESAEYLAGQTEARQAGTGQGAGFANHWPEACAEARAQAAVAHNAMQDGHAPGAA